MSDPAMACGNTKRLGLDGTRDQTRFAARFKNSPNELKGSQNAFSGKSL